jgi:hypothetical protein
MAKPRLAERLNQLGTAIEAARSRLGKRSDFENDDIGDLLETINDDLETVTHDDPERAHARYDSIEARLEAVRNRLDATRPKD